MDILVVNVDKIGKQQDDMKDKMGEMKNNFDTKIQDLSARINTRSEKESSNALSIENIVRIFFSLSFISIKIGHFCICIVVIFYFNMLHEQGMF